MRISLLLLFFFISLFASGQNKQLLYNFTPLPQSLMSNPGAEITFDKHFGIPFLSQVHVSVGSSGVSMYDIFKDDGTDINSRISRQLSKMTRKDFFSVNQQLEILFFGWRDNQKRYFSGGIYQELDAFGYFPKDLAVLVYEGNKEHIGESFRFSDAAFTAEVLNVFHFGFTNFYSEDLIYGIRAKLYSSIFNANSIDNRGRFSTIPSPSGPNLYRHFLSGIDILVNTSGYASLLDSDGNAGKLLAKRALLGGNLGLGLDFGFTYYFNDRTKLSGSVLDFGFIYHNKDVESYWYHGNYQTDGIGLLFPGPNENPNYWDDWEDNLDKHLKDETLHDPYATWRPVKLNTSLDFGFSENKEPCNCHRPQGRRRYYNHVGLQFFAIKRPKGFLGAATLSFDRRFSDTFHGKITYTVNPYTFSNIGFLLSTKIHNFNFYLAADNLLSYTNLAKAHNASVQFGFQFIIDRE